MQLQLGGDKMQDKTIKALFTRYGFKRDGRMFYNHNTIIIAEHKKFLNYHNKNLSRLVRENKIKVKSLANNTFVGFWQNIQGFRSKGEGYVSKNYRNQVRKLSEPMAVGFCSTN